MGDTVNKCGEGNTIIYDIYIPFTRWHFLCNFISKGCNLVTYGQVTEKSNWLWTETILHILLMLKFQSDHACFPRGEAGVRNNMVSAYPKQRQQIRSPIKQQTLQCTGTIIHIHVTEKKINQLTTDEIPPSMVQLSDLALSDEAVTGILLEDPLAVVSLLLSIFCSTSDISSNGGTSISSAILHLQKPKNK